MFPEQVTLSTFC